MRTGATTVGLPGEVEACLFDLDGVLTRTATVHAQAWKEMFDGFLASRARQSGERFVPFDVDHDYKDSVDGRTRVDGTRTFLASRGIVLPEGDATDPPGTPTVQGLSNQKNELFIHVLARDGVEVYDGSVRYVRAARAAGLRCAVVSSSVNTAHVLRAAGIADLFDARVDGGDVMRRHLAGKPSPDTYLAAAEVLHVGPPKAAVFEDAIAGVEAGRAGAFRCVIGVDRGGQHDALLAHGADIVVSDLADLLAG